MQDAPSKTRRKKDMLALQDLGEELIRLNAGQLDSLRLPDALLQAIQQAQRITSFSARRRQLQYVGRLMREVDPAPIQEKLAAWRGASRAHTAWLHKIELWRERLLHDEHALEELKQAAPDADLQQLRTLIRNAHKETLENRPPRSFRALFQALREIFPEAPASGE
jgi:ribosome-associated protein